MKIRILLCLAAAGSLLAQEAPPRAEPADPAMQPNPGEDWYQHGRNLYESAKSAANPDQKFDLYARAIDVFTRYLGQFPIIGMRRRPTGISGKATMPRAGWTMPSAAITA